MQLPGAVDPLEHFASLKRLLALEHAEERARGTALREGLTLLEREARGLTLLDLECLDEDAGLGGRFLLTFARADSKPLPFALHPGDFVALRPRRAEVPEAANGLVARASRTRLTVAFDRPPPPFVREGRVVVDVVANDVTYQRTRAAVDRVAALDRGRARRKRDLLVGATTPVFEPPPALVHSLPPPRPLNPEQREALARASAARDFFLVHGPPGTGKSTVLLAIAEEAIARGERVLLTAASNAAVDHLLERALDRGLSALRIGHPARVSPALQSHTLDLQVVDHPDWVLARDLFDEAHEHLGYARRQRTQGRSRQRFSQARASQAEARKLLDEARALERKAVASVLGRAQVIASTLATLAGDTLADVSFDLALVDEATQATEPLTLVAWPRAERLVLAGDPQQLPPTVLSREAAAQGLQKSLFQRLLEAHGEGVKSLLKEQYRMNAQIMEVPNRAFYAGELRAHPSVASHTLAGQLVSPSMLDVPPVLFLDTAGKGFDDAVETEGGSVFNEGEAELVRAHAKRLLAAGLAPSALALIAPYRAQVARLRPGFEETEVEVDTVDAFQGREKEAILISLTRSNADGQLGFLEDLRRINVALTRARRHLFVVGDSATLARHAFYASLIEAVQAQGGYRSAWEWPDA